MNDANLFLQRHAGNGIVDALLYWFGVVEVDGQLTSLLCAGGGYSRHRQCAG